MWKNSKPSVPCRAREQHRVKQYSIIHCASQAFTRGDGPLRNLGGTLYCSLERPGGGGVLTRLPLLFPFSTGSPFGDDLVTPNFWPLFYDLEVQR